MSNWQQESNLSTERCNNAWDSLGVKRESSGEVSEAVLEKQAVCFLQLLVGAAKPMQAFW